jgi:4-hydroxyphenylpyruvate dioxygenase
MSGGTGASSKKLVGFANFKRHNPMSDRFEMTDFDHLELYCHDATSVARRFATAFGMQMVASTDVDSGNHKYSSYCIQCENIRFVFTAPYYTDAPDSTKTRTETFPHLDTASMETFIKRHGVAGAPSESVLRMPPRPTSRLLPTAQPAAPSPPPSPMRTVP